MRFPKPQPVIDQKYRAWVESKPCLVCDKTKAGYKQGCNDAHHVGDGKGGSAKRNDHRLLPLCWEHHREYHQIGRKSWMEKNKILDLEVFIAAYRKLYERCQNERN